jgi:hypothetical protein
MTKLQKAGMWLTGIFGAIAGIAAIKYSGPSPVSAPVGGISLDWLSTALTALGLGGFTSLPVLIPKLVDLFKRFVLPLLPAGVGGAKIGGVIDGAQIAAYLLLISKAKTDDERAALLIAGRASCDAFRDELFPVPAFPVPAAKVSA